MNRMRFGKYRNVEFEDIPADYILWLLRHDWFDGDARDELENWVSEEDRESDLLEQAERIQKEFKDSFKNGHKFEFNVQSRYSDEQKREKDMLAKFMEDIPPF